MYELDPWPEDDDDRPNDHKDAVKTTSSQSSKSPAFRPSSVPRSPSPDAWEARNSSPSSFSSHSRSRSRVMFAGPPPPIASSVLVPKVARGQRQTDPTHASSQSRGKQGSLGNLTFDHRRDTQPGNQPDSVWHGIRRREKALEKEAQQLLDLQATGLIAGSNGIASPGTDTDGQSDTGSSTPTGTFYSTATSKSRMVNSLHVPTRSTREGNVIPVRQPKSSKPRGLRSARTGLRRTISALAHLKAEEDAHIDDALAERSRALAHLNKLDQRKERVSTELHSLEEDEEEPLGKEMRDLGTRYDEVTNEIRELEERLVGMRNQRRWLRGRMEDVRNRREAGLSGYRGALKDVESEVKSLMVRPPIQPLDLQVPESLTGDESSAPAGGFEFLRMIPERRTVEMAKGWWEAEVSVLERRKSQVGADRRALEDGGAVWAEVTQIVSDYEVKLRELMSGNQSPVAAPHPPDGQEGDLLLHQLSEMQNVMDKLEAHQRHAEKEGWNLLICAIGAELEAFTEAREMLSSSAPDGCSENQGQDLKTADIGTDASGHVDQDRHDESSDNEVPADLLVSQADDAASNVPSVASPETGPSLVRTESEGDVPAEFLAEHRDKLE